MSLKVGDTLITPYGEGKLVGYRGLDATYTICLDKNDFKGILYCSKLHYTMWIEKERLDKLEKQNILLNGAYESLEQMRRFNFDVTCQEVGIPLSIKNHEVCATCLLASAPPPPLQQIQIQAATKKASSTTTNTSRSPFFSLTRKSSQASSQPPAKTTLSEEENQSNETLPLSSLESEFSSSGLPADSITSTAVNSSQHQPTIKSSASFSDSSTTKSRNSRFPNLFRRSNTTPTTTFPEENSQGNLMSGSRALENVNIGTEDANSGNRDSLENSKSSHASSTVTATPKASAAVKSTKKVPPAPKTKSRPCLACGTPCCSKHSSKEWRKHRSVNMCTACESVFGMDFVISLLTTPKDNKRQQKLVDQILDIYDRLSILLCYSNNYIDEIANSLDRRTTRNQVWGIGSSSAGMISGVLGLAATATFFTPAGPPLMIASLVFGGSASVVQTGADVTLNSSEPNKLADRIIALYGALHSCLRVVNTIRDALVRDHTMNYNSMYIFDDEIESDAVGLRKKNGVNSSVSGIVQELYEQNRVSLLSAATATRGSAAVVTSASATAATASSTAVSAAEVGAYAGKNARFFSRGSVAAASTALTFAQFAGGVLSAATLVLEARSMNHTINTFNDGSSKSKQLRYIKKCIVASFHNGCFDEQTLQDETMIGNIDENNDSDSDDVPVRIVLIPSTTDIDSEIKSYLNVLRYRIRAMTEAEVTKLLLEQNEEIALEEQQDQDPHINNEDLLLEDNSCTSDKEEIRQRQHDNGNVPVEPDTLSNDSNNAASMGLTPATMLLRRIEQQMQEKQQLQQTSFIGEEKKDNAIKDDDSDVVSWNGADTSFDSVDSNRNVNLIV